MSHPALLDPETSLLALLSLDTGKPLPGCPHRSLPTKADYDSKMQDTFAKPPEALHKYMNVYIC